MCTKHQAVHHTSSFATWHARATTPSSTLPTEVQTAARSFTTTFSTTCERLHHHHRPIQRPMTQSVLSQFAYLTLALSTGNYYRSICMVGSFDGEYALRNMLQDAEDRSVIVGHVTCASYGIINHIDIDYYAHGNEQLRPANDNKIRVLDVATNTFLSDPGSNVNASLRSGQLSGHTYPWSVNCTSMCPHGKLRVVVGDTTDMSTIDAESGRYERILKGHKNYGFACAWSPEGYYIATAHQDRLVKIWEVRGGRVVTEFAAQTAGYRSMRGSPVGGCSKCLLLAEPEDRVCIVNATTYETMQTHRFYGEIVGWISTVTRRGSGSRMRTRRLAA